MDTNLRAWTADSINLNERTKTSIRRLRPKPTLQHCLAIDASASTETVAENGGYFTK